MSGTIEPVLVEGLDQVLLIRLYPEAAEALQPLAGDAALAQGVETAAAGAVLESSQYEPLLEILDAPEEVAPEPGAHRTPRSTSMCAHVQRVGSELSCTMGNWEGMQAEPAQLRLSVAAGWRRLSNRRHGIAAHHGGRRWQDRDMRGVGNQCAGDHRSAAEQRRGGDGPLMASLAQLQADVASCT